MCERSMDESLIQFLASIHVPLGAYRQSTVSDRIYHVEIPWDRLRETWAELCKVSRDNGYLPVIRGGASKPPEELECDPESILAKVPSGNIREILAPLVQARLESLREEKSDSFDGDFDLEQLAQSADASGIYFDGPRTRVEYRPTPRVKPKLKRPSFQTIKGTKGQAQLVSLVKGRHRYELPAYLSFGGWNECPPPHIQVAILREWQGTYGAVPMCMTNDVLEFAVKHPPRNEADALKLAAEQWIFCEDIVSQGTESIRSLAKEICNSQTWFFWWD
jgi:hypothetical protein